MQTPYSAPTLAPTPGQAFPRTVALVLALGLTFGLGLAALGCGGSKPGPSLDQPYSKLRIGMSGSYPPLVFEEDGKLVGFEPDMAKLVERDLGVKVELVEIPLPELIPALLDRRIDLIMSGMSVTPEREQRVRFTTPYMRVGQMAMIRQEDLARLSPVTLIHQDGMRVAVKRGSTGEALVTRMQGPTVMPFDTVEEGVDALAAGEVDYLVHDAPTIWRYTSHADQDDRFMGLYQRLNEETLAWAVRPEDAQLATALNNAMVQWVVKYEFQPIQSKWIPMTISVE